MQITITRAQAGTVEIQLPEDVDLSDPRVLQGPTYSLSPEPGAAPAAVLSVGALAPNTIALKHDPTDLGASYVLNVGPLSSISGGDRPPEALPLVGSGAALSMSAAPSGVDGVVLRISPDSVVPTTTSVAARPMQRYPVFPVFASVVPQADKSVLARASGWTEVPYDLVVGAAQETLTWGAATSGSVVVDGPVAQLNPGGAVFVQASSRGAPVLDVFAAAPAGSVLRVRVGGGGRVLVAAAEVMTDGRWTVATPRGSAVIPAGPLVLRLALNLPTGRFAVFADGGIIDGGQVAGLPAGADGARLESAAGPALVALWLADVVLADKAGNPLLARASFFGGPPGRLARTLKTLKRPLVAFLGPHVPANPEDVRLTIGGVEVAVAAVDPYAGVITPAIPIPRGTKDVKIEYETTPHLVFPLLASEPGLWADEVTAPVGPDSYGYPFTTILYTGPRPRPPRIAHRYLAARRVTSSLTGDPVGLRVGRDPRTGQPPPIVRPRPALEAQARTVAEAAAPPWYQVGSGEVRPGSGSAGFETVPDGAFVVAQDADMRDLARAYVTARLDAGPVSMATLVAGPAIGFHDESRLYVLAVLDSAGSRYVGMLLDPERPSELASWSVWPRSPVRAESRALLTADPADLPRLLSVGDALRIPAGRQAGAYRVTSLRGTWPSGRTEIGISPALPADPEEFAARDATAWFDLGPGTQVIRLEADMATGTASVSSAGFRAVLSSDTSARPAPGRFLQDHQLGSAPGRFFFGHLGPGQAAQWGALAAAALPSENPARIARRLVAGPVALPDPEWAEVGEVTASPSEVLVTSGDAESGLLRPDRALGPDALSSARWTARSQFSQGTLDLRAEMSNGERRIILGSVVYDEVPGRNPYRQIVYAPPTVVGTGNPPAPPVWSLVGMGTWDSLGNLAVAPRQVAQWSTVVPGDRGRILDMRISPPAQAGATLTIRAEAGGGTISAALEITAGLLRVLTPAGAEAVRRPISTPMQALGGLIPGAGLILLIAGDAVPLLVPAAQLQDPAAAGALKISLANTARRASASASVSRLVVTEMAPPGARYTFGMLRDAMSPGDIDAWEMPREDASAAPNSAEVGPVIREMDPRADSDLRVVLDPAWGAIFLRPDLPPPPYYDPLKSRFAGDMSEPSAGWVNVSYDELPLAPGDAPYVWIGAGPGARARVADISISIEARSAPGEVGYVPRAEIGRDDPADSGDQAQTPFAALARVVPAPRSASIRPTGLWMRTLLDVRDGPRVLVPPDVSIDLDTQEIHLAAGVPDFSGGVIEVRGNPALPVNETYLRQLPVRGSPNEVGEDTPPHFPRYFSWPDPKILPDPRSTGRAIEFPIPPPETPLLARSVFSLEDPGQRGLITFPSDDPGEGGTGATDENGDPVPTPPGPPPDGGGPVIVLSGGLFWDRFPVFDDGTSRGFVLLNGPFKPAGGRFRGTPTIDVPPFRPAAVLLPARGLLGRGNPRVILTGPGGTPIPLPTDTLALFSAGPVTMELDDHVTVKTYTFTG